MGLYSSRGCWSAVQSENPCWKSTALKGEILLKCLIFSDTIIIELAMHWKHRAGKEEGVKSRFTGKDIEER